VFPGVRDKTSVSFRDKTKPSNTGVETSPFVGFVPWRNIFRPPQGRCRAPKFFLPNLPNHMMADISPQWMIGQKEKVCQRSPTSMKGFQIEAMRPIQNQYYHAPKRRDLKLRKQTSTEKKRSLENQGEQNARSASPSSHPVR
jgi:hypothetical protein